MNIIILNINKHEFSQWQVSTLTEAPTFLWGEGRPLLPGSSYLSSACHPLRFTVPIQTRLGIPRPMECLIWIIFQPWLFSKPPSWITNFAGHSSPVHKKGPCSPHPWARICESMPHPWRSASIKSALPITGLCETHLGALKSVNVWAPMQTHKIGIPGSGSLHVNSFLEVPRWL